MQKRPLGNTGIRIAPIAIGGWLTFGAGVPDPIAHRTLAAALDAGVDFIDLADVYGGGRAESVVGSFLAGRRRDDVVLSSKVFWPTSDDPRDRGLGRDHVRSSIEASLRRLRVDHLDLYFCHREDLSTPLEETVAVMSELVREGRIRAWGTSCWRPATLDRVHALARRDGEVPPAVEQPQLSLLHRRAERAVLPVAGRLGMGVVVWSPLAGGVLTGKYLDGRPPGSRAATSDQLTPDLTTDRARRVAALVAIARDLGTTPATLALAWVIGCHGVTAAITGATAPEQIEANVQAAGFELDPSVRRELDRVFPPPPRSLLRRAIARLIGRRN